MASPRPMPQSYQGFSDAVAASNGSVGRSAHAPEFPGTEARTRGMNRGRSISVTFAGSFGNLSQQTPARSYVQRAAHSNSGNGDLSQANSETVREDTAELASRAIEDDSIYSSSPGTRFWDDEQLSGRQLPADSTSLAHRSSTGRLRREAREEHRPQAIREEPEPLSPVDTRSGGQTSRVDSTDPMYLVSERTLASASSEDEEGDDAEPLSSVTINPATISQPHERTPLMRGKYDKPYTSRAAGGGGGGQSSHDLESQKEQQPGVFGSLRASVRQAGYTTRHIAAVAVRPSSWDRKAAWNKAVVEPAGYLPAVILGLLLNVLDALSYGMILFPLGVPMFEGMGSDGISMFYVSCIVSQLVFSLGGSVFRGGIGSEMIEVVPFFHSMAYAIIGRIGEDSPHSVRATTILAYSISSIITGLAFYLLGSLKLGALIGFFPRHILIGCIGGVGFFLVITGLEVSARLDGNFAYNLQTLQKLIATDTLPLWTVPLALAVMLITLKRYVKHSLTDAVYFVSIIVIFYILVVAIPQLSIADLRAKGWIFEAPEVGKPWWDFYTLYDFEAVDYEALAETIPAMLALTFFGLLHVPINVPALALTTGEDNLDLDRELRAHGYSNALSGLCGSIQNYLVYTNTVLFVRAGADSRVAGVLLAAATAGILVSGPAIIGYIPIMVVGALIFFLGIDLLREALFDTWGKAGKLEYLTIVIIVLTMGIYDFVVGIGVGIILACVSFVFQTSQISAVRGTLPGNVASSTVRRHPMQRHYLSEVGTQVYVMRLAGYLFFGTIVGVENEIRKVLADERFKHQPISFLVLDLSQVDGVDFSAAEAFTRINRLLTRKDVRMIMCGFPMDSSIGKNLANVGLFEEDDEIGFFTALNPALEFCENEMLKTFYQRREYMLASGNETHHHQQQSQFLDVPRPDRRPSASLEDSISNSPRRGQMHRAAASTLLSQQDPSAQRQWQRYKQPLQLILQTLSPLVPQQKEEFWQKLVPYLERETWAAGSVLYQRGDAADGFYLLQTGVLKAKYELEQGSFSEVIVAGATCGELPFFGEEERTSTTVAERESVTWVLRRSRWEEMQRQDYDVARELLKISLKLTGERMETITKYMLLTGT